MTINKLVAGVKGDPLNSSGADVRDAVNGLIDATEATDGAFFNSSKGKNLFDKTLVTSGFMGTDGVIVASGTYVVSDFIAVSELQDYYGSAGNDNMRFVTAFDASKVVIPSSGVSAASFLYNVPAGVSFVRVTCNATSINHFQFEQSSSKTSYEPFGDRLASIDEYRKDFPWAGFTWTSFGDSLVAQDRWQPTTAAKTGLIHTNKGVGGSLITGADGSATAICQDARINTIPLWASVVTVLGGTNDWAQNVAMGVLSDTDPAATFYGGLNTLFSKLTTRLPTARIFACTPPYSEFIDFAGRGWPNATTNTAGLVISDYAEAIRLAAKKWGVPVIDIGAECGWNEVNITTYVEDDGALLHPNNTGATRMAEVAISKIKDLKLISS